ncbi:MAG: hypothetical protein K9M45_09760 [Kiritimatiellales bacterium]|nr:hypothetical protein [Kiritimatiellales bacterium]
MRRALTTGILSAILAGLASAKTIPATEAEIAVRGTKYVSKTETGLRFQRHREDLLQLPQNKLGFNPDKARNTSGIVLAFKTDSKNLTLKFHVLSVNYMGLAFGVFENGRLTKEFKFNQKSEKAVLEFSSESPGAAPFEIALPSFADVEFQSLEIDDGAKLIELPTLGKKVYVALGDSISHGVGQNGTSHKTWPFLLSRKLDCELFNLAVGGGKISIPTADMLGDWDRIDLITILIGYNDLHFDGKTPQTYRNKYNELLDAIRKTHPETRIYCISLLYTKKPKSEKTGATAADFRKALAGLVAERRKKDSNLFLVAGDKITSGKNLRADNPNDPVHLGVEGAALLADELFSIIKK